MYNERNDVSRTKTEVQPHSIPNDEKHQVCGFDKNISRVKNYLNSLEMNNLQIKMWWYTILLKQMFSLGIFFYRLR